MRPLFSSEEYAPIPTPPTNKPLSCPSCGLYKNAKKMGEFGKCKKEIMIVGDAPGSAENKAGRPWVGLYGRKLEKALRQRNIDLAEDCVSINAVNCRPQDDEPPSPHEIACCRKRVYQVVQKYKPKVIIVLGEAALKSVVGGLRSGGLGGLIKWRGFQIPDRQLKAWICPTFNLDFVDNSKGTLVKTIWKQDFYAALDLLEKEFPKWEDETKYIEIIDDLSILDNQGYNVSFDFETTGLKPHKKGHRIVCVSVAVSETKAYAFLIPDTRKALWPFLNLLQNPHIGKIAANMKFEDTWSLVRLKCRVTNWIWDTMQAAHILDNRPKICGLKFQTYVNFGVADYSAAIKPFLESGSKDGNAFNRILEFMDKPNGMEDALIYCGLDSIYEYKLAKIQMDKIILRKYNASNNR